MPLMKRASLRFEGDTALEYLELRKLGLFSKKAFRNAQSLRLAYDGNYQLLENKHIEILAKNLNRGLRKLKNLSIKFECHRGSRVDMGPLLKSVKQTFVNLVHLKLSLKEVFEFSAWDLYSFERLFLKLRPTLRYLDLDFSRSRQQGKKYFSEALCAVIMSGLPRLEGLCLDFSHTDFSTRIVGQLIYGTSTHLTSLRSLDINIEYCSVDQVQVSSCSRIRRFMRKSSGLQDLKLNLSGCQGLSEGFLSLLQWDIVRLCPKLKRLFICAAYNTRVSNEFFAALENKFLQRLDLKWFRLLYSHDLERALENDFTEVLNIEKERQAFELKQIMELERKVEEIKLRAGGEEEISLYLNALRDEEQAPAEYELDELEEEMEKEQELEDRIEAEIRLGDLTEGGQVTKIDLDYDDYYY